MGVFAGTERQCTEDEHDDEDEHDSQISEFGLSGPRRSASDSNQSDRVIRGERPLLTRGCLRTRNRES
jgi:hypothetical protein